jgi:hypothetical protein
VTRVGWDEVGWIGSEEREVQEGIFLRGGDEEKLIVEWR